ncbi:MAG: PQQ-binding-like beta-propeller repeat protein [Planctomycetaceae bacterium]|jgi:outer membrane protein assembly factor BamB|nr:PQQ-binding-like beta-propeller repeat protein [Planctomycetaceae bacterium]
MKKKFVFILYVLFFPLSVLYADWTLFRGDAGASGCVKETVAFLETPEILWEYRLEKGWFQATAVIAENPEFGDTVYIGSSDDGMLAFDLKNGQLRWKYPLELGVLSPAAYSNNRIFFGDTDGILYALNAQTGKELWKFKTGGTIDNSPNIDLKTNRVLISSQDGSLYALDAATGKSIWEYKTENQIRCFPAITERCCFVAGCDSQFHVVDLDRGTVLNKVALDAPTGSTPAVLGDLVFFGTEGNEFLCINWKKAEIIWRFASKQTFRAPAACQDGVVVFGGFDKTVHAVDAQTGKEHWTFKTKGRLEAGPVILGNRVYVASTDSSLSVLDLKNGNKLAAVPMSGKLLASPAIIRGKLVVGADDGILSCLRIADWVPKK